MENVDESVIGLFAGRYDESRIPLTREELAASFYERLKYKRGGLLNLGCGSGDAFSQVFLENNWRVMGVDKDEAALARAHIAQPKMRTHCKDIIDVDFDIHRFEAVVAIDSLFMVPRDAQHDLFYKISNWLQEDGLFLFTYLAENLTGHEEYEGEMSLYGKMENCSHNSPGELFHDLRKAGFSLVSADYKELDGETLLWCIARKAEPE